MESSIHRLASLTFVFVVLISIPCVTTADEAEERSTTSRCFQPINPGPCRAYFPRWAWSAPKNDCVYFIYGGCKKNRNNFDSKEECVDECIYEAAPAKAKEGKCPMIQPAIKGVCFKMCHHDLDCAGTQKCCSNGCGQICTNPVDPDEVRIKPGECPGVDKDNQEDCKDTCGIDDQCPGTQRCCPNTCGASCMEVMSPSEEPPESECALEWTAHNNTCYKFVSYSRNYQQAAVACQKEHKKAHLAVLVDEQEAEWAHKFIRNQTNFQTSNGAWIGLKLEADKWTWNDGSTLTYATDMGVNREKEQCVYLLQKMDIFHAASCRYTKQYLCQYSLQGEYSPAAQQTSDSSSNIVMDTYIIIGILATVVLCLIVVGIILYMKCRRRIIRTGDNSVTVVKYKGYQPVLI